jgi:GT2 family glycosyltransferase
MPTIDVVRLDRDAAALNEELGRTTANYLMLLEPGAQRTETSVEIVQDIATRFPEADVIYGDSVDARDRYALLRPAFSPLRLRSQDYMGAVKVFRAELVRTLGGFNADRDGVHGYDLALRAAANAARVLHVPAGLDITALASEPAIAPRGPNADPLREQRRGAVYDHLRALEIKADIDVTSRGSFDIRYSVEGEPLVSIIVPTNGSSAQVGGRRRVLVVDALRRILEISTYRNFEVVVVADDDTPQVVIDSLIEVVGDRLKLVRWSNPFNFSGKINRGAAWAAGDYLIPLNDDVELISRDWIERLLGLAQQPGIGVVGTELYFEDGTIQHAGHVYRNGGAGHIGIGWHSNWDDQLASMGTDREVSGVTAACLMVPADVFWRVGGFCNLLPGNYNDADFCLKITSTGLSAVWTPHVKLYHFESRSRVPTVTRSEVRTLQSRWGSRIQLDPFWPMS